MAFVTKKYPRKSNSLKKRQPRKSKIDVSDLHNDHPVYLAMPQSKTRAGSQRFKKHEKLVLSVNRKSASSSQQLVRAKTIHFHELPLWMQDNTFIRSGYRLPNQSYLFYVRSLGYLHNEFANIWSHLIGCIVFVVLMFTTAFYIFPKINTLAWTDVLVTYTFLAGAVGCLLFSAIYHTFLCHSETVINALNICDYVGIVSLIIGSCVPTFFYAFHCHNFYKILYISMIIFFGVITIILAVNPVFSIPKWRPMRALTFILMGFSGAIPATHSLYAFGYQHTLHALQLVYTTPMALLYLTGAIIYGSRVPERWFPGKFDIWFHSHQIFHYFVVAAACFHYISVISALQWSHSLTPHCSL